MFARDRCCCRFGFGWSPPNRAQSPSVPIVSMIERVFFLSPPRLPTSPGRGLRKNSKYSAANTRLSIYSSRRSARSCLNPSALYVVVQLYLGVRGCNIFPRLAGLFCVIMANKSRSACLNSPIVVHPVIPIPFNMRKLQRHAWFGVRCRWGQGK
jgi:hypothetical protein